MAQKHHHKHSRLFNTQFMTSCISTTLVLVLLGTIVLFVLTARNLSAYVRENINVSVLISDELTEGEIDSMRLGLLNTEFVKSVEYISKERALEETTTELGTDPADFLGFNPFTASFELKVKADYANTDSLSKIVGRLDADEDVMGVDYDKETMDSVNKNIRKISVILLVIAALFLYISFALINNTVRLTIFSKRFLINTMKLVGASWGFIRRPFLNRAFMLGVISAILADVVLWLGVEWMKNYEPGIREVITMDVMYIVAGSVIVFGLFITFMCTYISLGRYLKMNSKELYNV